MKPAGLTRSAHRKTQWFYVRGQHPAELRLPVSQLSQLAQHSQYTLA